MNPIAYHIKPREPLYFLLIGEMVWYRDGKEPERVWNLNIYSSVKTRLTAAKKMKRHSSDIIFIKWEITMNEIVKRGKYLTVLQADKVLLSDKLDILKQITKGK